VLIVNIKGLPRNVTQKRYLSISFAGQDVTLPYTVTNKSTATSVRSHRRFDDNVQNLSHFQD
jgi:hypothetical protein